MQFWYNKAKFFFRHNEREKQHESILFEKAERIEELSRKLAETQKRLTELIVASSNQDLETQLGDPVKEICNLKSQLASLAQQKNEQSKQIHDLVVSDMSLLVLKVGF